LLVIEFGMAKELSAPGQIDQQAFGGVVGSSDSIHYHASRFG